MPKFTVSEAGKSPQNYKFDSNQELITIGRGSDNDITIDCESVSTKHCRVEKSDDGYVLSDDGSTNGIKLKGKKSESIELTDGIEVHIGDTPLTFHSQKSAAIAKGSGESPEESNDSTSEASGGKCLKTVIFFGILAIAGIAIMPWLGEVGMASEKVGTDQAKWLGFLGEFHPVFLHLPIGAFALVLLMEICRIFTFGKYKPRTTMALAFASGTAVFAAVFGYFLYLTGEFSGDLIEEHKRDGIIFTIILIATFLVKYAADALPLKRMLKPIYGVGVLATTAAMICAGHHGGEITHGDPFEKAPWIEEDDDQAGMSDAEKLDPIVYKHIVHPILEDKCISCHGEKKQKSGLRMDSYAALIEGGDEEEALVPGNLEESMMIAYLHLPLEDDLRMPPEGKTQLTPEEIQILEWWVASGASETAKKSEIEITPVISKALDSLVSPAEKARLKALADEQESLRLAAQKKKRQALEVSLNTVNEKFPGSLKYISQEDTSLVFSAVSYRSQFGDDSLDILASTTDSLQELNLGSTQVTDEGIKKLSAHPAIEVIKLSETSVTDASLPELAKLKQLRVLNLYGTAVTDAGIKALEGHPTLKKIYLWQTKVTPEAAQALEKSLIEVQPEKGKDKMGDEITIPAAQVILGS
ncbi:MAG: FHA domain-containing protein [Akkermansiaceae bacterium]